MFIVLVAYKKNLGIIDKYIDAHRTFLDEGYQKDIFIASGPMNPRIGGVILSQLTSRTDLEIFLKHDPFFLHNLASYKIIEFDPNKYHPDFSKFINDKSE